MSEDKIISPAKVGWKNLVLIELITLESMGQSNHN